MRITRNQPVTREKRELARQLRKTMTTQEEILWRALRNKGLGNVRFRRQQVIAGFVVDFYCPSARLAIEVDGTSHTARKQYDADRDRVLSELGIRTLRIGNESVERDLAGVLRRIEEDLTPSP